MFEHVDLLLINPGGRQDGYQKLGNDLAAIEPPIWIALLATNIRQAGFSVAICDADAEEITHKQIAQRVAETKPLLAATIVFGANPSASTQKMTSAGAICSAIRAKTPNVKQLLGGLHVSALPKRTMQEEDVDFVCQGEGPFTLQSLLAKLKAGEDSFSDVPGLWYRSNGDILSTSPAPLIQNLDAELPAAAWDLLPMDKYRAHNWHCFDHMDERNNYAVIYTSLGCPFNCHFCCINALFGSSGIRYRSIEQVVDEIDLLVERYGVKNIKILDELFVLKRDRTELFCDLMIERGYDLNFWAYARVDTVDPEILHKLRRAGVRWLAYGFESACETVRKGVSKRFTNEMVENAIKWSKDAGIYIIANYIVGLPDDDQETMQQTLDEAIRHNFEYLNLYCAMAYPGSKLYDEALAENWQLPESWHGYSQLGSETLPLPTRHLTSAEVLTFRDQAFMKYHDRPEYLQMIKDKFGEKVLAHIQSMLERKISRKFC